MHLRGHSLLVFLILSLGLLTSPVHSNTNSQDVSALNEMFTSLKSPSQLQGWQSSGGDPCGDYWTGIQCSGSSVTEINLSGLRLTGSMGYQLSSLKSVTYFDLSKNNLKNDLPYQLPPNLVHLDLSSNAFQGELPYSISQMSDLEYLDLNHNQLNGQLSDMFLKLPNLKTLDVSHNSLSGNLPQSFAELKSLDTLHLQNNHFTGTINILAGLPLHDLNVENNKFTGRIPDTLKGIDILETGGNSWSSGPAPPGFESANEHKKENKGKQKTGLNGLAIALIVLAALVVVALLIILLSRRRSSPSSHFLDEERGSWRKSFTYFSSREVSKDLKEKKSFGSNNSIDVKTMQKATSFGYKASPSDFAQSISDNEFASRLNSKISMSLFPATPIAYSLADMQNATGNFARGSLLGEGSVGCVYRTTKEDGKVLAVKKIDLSLLQNRRPEEFSEMVSNISKVRHPNIAVLIGYCSEKGYNMLIYEYFRNGSLDDFLHKSDDYSNPLTWNTRVRIALGAARAVEYLHEVCNQTFVHKNIKSSNILLDLELSPCLTDYGLANFHDRTSQNLGIGYNAPECTKPSAYTKKSDVYSFGVVMLELLTGRMPLDMSKPKSEQCLVRWAKPRLHDTEALGKMVDPALRGLYPPESLSRFADIISECVKEEAGDRPRMREVVQWLVNLVEESSS